MTIHVVARVKQMALPLLASGLLLGLPACKKPTPEPPAPGPVVPAPPAPPAPADAVVYEAFVRDASASGSFDDFLPRLDSIKSLGANVLWLMPVHPIGQVRRVGPVGSPYSVKDYYDVSADFGDLAAFDRLVRAAHQRRLAVVLDWVANHTAWDNPWVQQHPDWYTHDANGAIVPPQPTWLDVADLNYDQPELRREMIRAMRFWVQQHGVDGFRCDAADLVPDDFWRTAIDSLNRVRPNLFWLAEGSRSSHWQSGFQLNFGWNFYSSLGRVFNQRANPALLAATHRQEVLGSPAGSYRLRFTTNHDFSAYENTPPVLYGSPAAAQAAYVATLAYGATPLIYSGQEAGDPARLGLFGKQLIRWNYSPATTTFYRRLLAAYNALPALRTGAVSPDNASPDAVLVLRGTAPQQVAVAVNVRNRPIVVARPAAWNAVSWRDAFSGQAVPAADSVALPAYGYVLWRSQ